MERFSENYFSKIEKKTENGQKMENFDGNLSEEKNSIPLILSNQRNVKNLSFFKAYISW